MGRRETVRIPGGARPRYEGPGLPRIVQRVPGLEEYPVVIKNNNLAREERKGTRFIEREILYIDRKKSTLMKKDQRNSAHKCFITIIFKSQDQTMTRFNPRGRKFCNLIMKLDKNVYKKINK